jgi:hypothetical protein
MSKPTRPCIFCGAKAHMSKEHLFAEWLAPYLPTSTYRGQETDTLEFAEASSFSYTTWANIRQGAVHTRKIRQVCAACNNGWMSRLQSTAAPVLRSLFRGDAIDIDCSTAFTIAKWVVMLTMVGEFTDEDSVAVLQSERSFFRERAEIPAGWRVWISHAAGDVWSNTRYAHFSSLRPLALLEPNSIYPHNAQSTTVGCGGLLFYACSRPPQLESFGPPTDVSDKLYRVHPPMQELAKFELQHRLSDSEAQRLADALRIFLEPRSVFFPQ